MGAVGMGDPMKRDINVPAGHRDLSRRERDTGHPPLGGVPCPEPTMPGALEALANRVRQLRPSHRDPEAFHEEKSEIEADLRRLARVLPGDGAYAAGSCMTASDGPVLVAKVPGLRKA